MCGAVTEFTECCNKLFLHARCTNVYSLMYCFVNCQIFSLPIMSTVLVFELGIVTVNRIFIPYLTFWLNTCFWEISVVNNIFDRLDIGCRSHSVTLCMQVVVSLHVMLSAFSALTPLVVWHISRLWNILTLAFWQRPRAGSGVVIGAGLRHRPTRPWPRAPRF